MPILVPSWVRAGARQLGIDAQLFDGPYGDDVDFGPVSGQKNRLVVIHTAETPEHDGMAWNLANYSANSVIRASWDISIDNKNLVWTCPYPRTSWAAPGVNGQAFNLEHAGRAAQGTAGWADQYSRDMLELSAKIVAVLCVHNPDGRIPVRRVTPTQIQAGAWGICGHVDVTQAYPHLGDGHTDPGSDFPWATYLARVQHYVNVLDGTTTQPTPTPEDDMPTPRDLWTAPVQSPLKDKAGNVAAASAERVLYAAGRYSIENANAIAALTIKLDGLIAALKAKGAI